MSQKVLILIYESLREIKEEIYKSAMFSFKACTKIWDCYVLIYNTFASGHVTLDLISPLTYNQSSL